MFHATGKATCHTLSTHALLHLRHGFSLRYQRSAPEPVYDKLFFIRKRSGKPKRSCESMRPQSQWCERSIKGRLHATHWARITSQGPDREPRTIDQSKTYRDMVMEVGMTARLLCTKDLSLPTTLRYLFSSPLPSAIDYSRCRVSLLREYRSLLSGAFFRSLIWM